MEKDYEFYKKFYEKNRVSLLQYANLREHFNKMVNEVLGADYYNTGMDIYQCDRICCEDITYKAASFFKKWQIIKGK
jgi:hypothetical protein